MADDDKEGVCICLEDYFSNYDNMAQERENERLHRQRRRTAIQNYLHTGDRPDECNGFQRMQKCRRGLEALDRRGWQRSFHQRMFHDNFIRACARIFWKNEPHGTFAKDHQKILEVNGWDHLAQEVLVSTPRRFGKTISVSMFAAAMLFSCPNLEMSIYSTCKVHVSLPEFDSLFILTPHNTAHIAKTAPEHPKVLGAHLYGNQLRTHEGDPHQHGGDRLARNGLRARRPDRQLLSEQGSCHLSLARELPVLLANGIHLAQPSHLRATLKVLRDQRFRRFLQSVQAVGSEADVRLVLPRNLLHQPAKRDLRDGVAVFTDFAPHGRHGRWRVLVAGFGGVRG